MADAVEQKRQASEPTENPSAPDDRPGDLRKRPGTIPFYTTIVVSPNAQVGDVVEVSNGRRATIDKLLGPRPRDGKPRAVVVIREH
jgi:hypothetical protein